MRKEVFDFPMIPATEDNINRRKLVYSVGINDASYVVKPTVDGVQVRCPYYDVWSSMVRRCYSLKWQDKYPNYKVFKVCKEWLTFTNFKTWMEQQCWQNSQLSKDVINPNSKVYSPENCVFVEGNVHKLLNYRSSARGTCKQGVATTPKGGYVAKCNNGTGKVVYIGAYPTEALAYEAYVNYKHNLILEVAAAQEDHRVRDGLLLHAKLLLDTLDDNE